MSNTTKFILGGLIVALALSFLIPVIWKAGRSVYPAVYGWAFGPDKTATSAPATAETQVPAVSNPAVQPVVVTSSDCLDRAAKLGAPINSAICTAPTSGLPAMQVKSGSQVVFGTITFDSETRVWILQKFVVPSYANYSFDYSGREQSVLNAPFATGSELSPVNNKPFTICWDVTSNGCVPPTKIEFFQ